MKAVLALVACSATWACSPAGASPPPTPAVAGSGGTPTYYQDPTSTTPADQCASAAYERTLLPSNLLFLVDRSGSMNCNLPPITDSATCESTATTADPTQPTKWSVIGAGLSSAFDQLGSVQNTSVGLTFFSTDDVCGAKSQPDVELGPMGPAQIASLKSAVSAVTPRGATPIVGATVLGFRHLHQEAQAPGNRFVVLVTDGNDSCLAQYAAAGVTGDPIADLLDVELPKALSVNIRTFVIGAPGSEPARGLLSKIAYYGGTARNPNCDHGDDPAPGAECHFDMTRSSDFARDLTTALQNVTGTAAMGCEFDVPRPADGGTVDYGTVNVDYYAGGNTTDPSTRTSLYRDDTAPCDAGANGWQYSADMSQIRLCGSICDTVRADVAAKVIVSIGCEQRVVIK